MSIYKAYKIYDGMDMENITPGIVAKLFSEMDSREQALFFNRVAEIATPWLTTQLQYITDEEGLNLAGRRVMQYIGDYSHWGLVPKPDLSFLEVTK